MERVSGGVMPAAAPAIMGLSLSINANRRTPIVLVRVVCRVILRWQRLPSFRKLADMLIDHLDGILNYCRTKVRFGVVEAVNGNIRMLINRGRGYKNMRYLLLKAKRMAVTNTEYVVFQKIKKVA